MFWSLPKLLVLIVPVTALWPIPRSLSTGNSSLVLSSSFNIDLHAIHQPPQDLWDAVERTKHFLKNDKLGRLVVGRGPGSSSLDNAPNLNKLKLSLKSNHAATVNTPPLILNSDYLSPETETLNVKIKSISQVTALPVEERDESYILYIPRDGSDATLTANTTLGLFRGLTTFSQIWYQYDHWTYTVEAPFDITDEPYYKWRGLLLDTARNFFPVDDIKRTLDAMSWTKINMFHWHIVDSQSFPVVLPELPELAKHGAYSSKQQYSTAELDDIVSYAAARGIDVMLEIDTPGHTAVIRNAYPEYVACFEATPWPTYANEPPAGQLRLTEPEVIDFTKKLFKAAIRHTPGKYFSTGGDEINMRCYQEDPVVQASLNSTGRTMQQALATFTSDTHKTLLDNGKTPVVWQEMVLDHGELGLSDHTVVLVWISSADAKAVVEAGYKIVHAPSDYFYLDCGHGAWVGNFLNGNSWCDPFKTWQKAYSFDPKANLTDSEATLVLGGQQLLWAEQSDPSNLDSIIWPRAAASAEVFWTGPTHPNGQPLNGVEALPRLHDLRYRYIHRGVKAIALQPEYCALRPHACDL
ncbi:putative exochitinase [Serendipita vermifera]|nr:putative exochitinase [Serendipita vermifera]